MKSLFISRHFLIGCVSGVVLSGIIFGSMQLRKKIYLTEEEKKSYVAGLQAGQSFQRYAFEVDYGALVLGAQDAKAKVERFSPEELNSVRTLIREEGRNRRGMGQNSEGRPMEVPISADAEGFFVTARGYKLKVEGSQKNFQELLAARTRVDQYNFDLVVEKITAGQAPQVLGQKMNLRFERRNVPRIFVDVYPLLGKGQTALVKDLDVRFLRDVLKTLQLKMSEDDYAAVRLKVKRLQ